MGKKRYNLLKGKILYTMLIIVIYLLCRNIPLYNIDMDLYLGATEDGGNLLMQTLGGDIKQCTIFALGISPYMIASIFVQIVMSFRSSEYKKRTSPMKMNKIIMQITLLVSIFMACVEVNNIQFAASGKELILAQITAVVEMIAGAMLIIYLSARNKKYGIGGQSAIIFVNIVDGIISTIVANRDKNLLLPIVISAIVLIIMVIMEYSEMRIAVQRISIHNIYGDKNYMAIKLNPIGVMPAMFATAFFMIPQFIMKLLAYIFYDNKLLVGINNDMNLTKPLGVGVYIFILYILTVFFSKIMLNPTEITDQYLKSGDSIQDIHAGADTKKYLSKVITTLGMISATVMSICLGVPLLLQMIGVIDSALVMLPSSIMMLTGIGCSLCGEMVAVKNLEGYETFI
ncbi:MAG: preprotein translocase subunit SecY [Lachnospiraceae bacterium]|nr:preprotein translocase subunit SecY [Lachnospiraceae bacterium]